MKPIRLQIMLGSKLIAEVIGSSDYVESVWIYWCALRYKRNKPLGCAATFLASVGRCWNIPVGTSL